MRWTSLKEGIAQCRREKAAHEIRDVGQQEVADGIGVNLQTYSRWERGDRVPRTPEVARIAAYFGVSEVYLRYGITDEEAAQPPRAGPSVIQEGTIRHVPAKGAEKEAKNDKKRREESA